MTHYEALVRTLFAALRNSANVYADRVFLDIAPPGTAMPYVVMVFAGGGDDNARAAKKSANILMQISVVSDDNLVAFAGVAQVDSLMDDEGRQDAGALDASAYGWKITTVTAGDMTGTPELFADAKLIYQYGKEYRVIMEEV